MCVTTDKRGPMQRSQYKQPGRLRTHNHIHTRTVVLICIYIYIRHRVSQETRQLVYSYRWYASQHCEKYAAEVSTESCSQVIQQVIHHKHTRAAFMHVFVLTAMIYIYVNFMSTEQYWLYKLYFAIYIKKTYWNILFQVYDLLPRSCDGLNWNQSEEFKICTYLKWFFL